MKIALLLIIVLSIAASASLGFWRNLSFRNKRALQKAAKKDWNRIKETWGQFTNRHRGVE